MYRRPSLPASSAWSLRTYVHTCTAALRAHDAVPRCSECLPRRRRLRSALGLEDVLHGRLGLHIDDGLAEPPNSRQRRTIGTHQAPSQIRAMRIVSRVGVNTVSDYAPRVNTYRRSRAPHSREPARPPRRYPSTGRPWRSGSSDARERCEDTDPSDDHRCNQEISEAKVSTHRVRGAVPHCLPCRGFRTACRELRMYTLRYQAARATYVRPHACELIRYGALVPPTALPPERHP